MPSSLDWLKTNGTVASGSHDTFVKTWDTAEAGLRSTNTWPAHKDTVHDLAFHPSEESVLVTCGAENAVLLWDTRTVGNSGPQTTLPSLQYSGSSVAAHALAWVDDDHLVLADAAGVLHLVDRRQPEQVLSSLPVHDGRVSRLRCSDGQIASISDDQSSAVLTLGESGKLEVLGRTAQCFEDLPHGLCWNSSTGEFLTCGLEPRLLHNTLKDGKVHTVDLTLDHDQITQIQF